MGIWTSFNVKRTYLLCSLVVVLPISSCNQKGKNNCSVSELPTYTKDVASIIEIKCFRCHDKEVYKTKASRTKIYDYKSLKKIAKNGLLIGSVTHAKGYIPMPYKSGEKIDDCSIATLIKWVETGMNE